VETDSVPYPHEVYGDGYAICCHSSSFTRRDSLYVESVGYVSSNSWAPKFCGVFVVWRLWEWSRRDCGGCGSGVCEGLCSKGDFEAKSGRYWVPNYYYLRPQQFSTLADERLNRVFLDSRPSLNGRRCRNATRGREQNCRNLGGAVKPEEAFRRMGPRKSGESSNELDSPASQPRGNW
jgi:hypothetical protein